MQDENTNEAGPPITGDPYRQNRLLVELIRKTIEELDYCAKEEGSKRIKYIANWLESEVSTIV